jgi:hypothetical protein
VTVGHQVKVAGTEIALCRRHFFAWALGLKISVHRRPPTMDLGDC